MYRQLLTASLVLFLGTGWGGAIWAQGGPNAGVPGNAGVGVLVGPGPNEDSLFIRRLADEILVNGKAYSNLRVLTKTIGGRLSGSPQYYQAEGWGQKALQDAGADNVWLQECMVPHWIRGGKDSASFQVYGGGSGSGGSGGAQALGSRSDAGVGLDILALGNSAGTGPDGILAPVMLIHSFEELLQRKDEIKGKIVFYNYPFNARLVEPFRAYGDAVRYRVYGASSAARYGAVGVLVRSMSESVDNNPHTGAMFYNDSFPKIPAAAVGLKDADLLAQWIEKKPPSQIKVYLRTLAQMLPDTLAHNVIGELRGSEYPDQYITVGGHLDSWDPAEGAQDDGAGCVHAIEVLRALKAIGYKPKHTIRVVLFANEENGGRGGDRYAEQATAKKEKHVFALESDAGGFTPRAFTMSLSEEKLAVIRSWLPLLQPYGVYAFHKGGGGADVTPIGQQLGVTVGELMPDGQRYFDYHHSRGDVLENVNKRELEMGALNMAALIYLVDKYGL